MCSDRIEELKEQIADLKKRWPAHSTPPAMMEQLDALEEELSREQKRRGGSDEDIDTGVQTLHLYAIGHVENEFVEPDAADRIRAAESRIILDPDLVDGLTGLKPGQQIMIVFYFHRSDSYDLLQHPRGDQSRSKRGVFTLHSPRRPNPIGVTVVDVIQIQDNVLRVRGLDAIHGTPVLDLKPV